MMVEQASRPVVFANYDSTNLANQLLNFLQQSRFHKSFMLLNNLSAAAQDLFAHTQSVIGHLQKGLNSTQMKKIEHSVSQFFDEEQKIIITFVNTTETKLAAYMANLTRSDVEWIQPLTGAMLNRIKKHVEPMYETVQQIKGAPDIAHICKLVMPLINEMNRADHSLLEEAAPAFNRTANLLPNLEPRDSKGRLKMLKKFTDLGYSILEKVRNTVALAKGTLAPMLSSKLGCGWTLEEVVELAQDRGPPAELTKVELPKLELPTESPAEKAPDTKTQASEEDKARDHERALQKEVTMLRKQVATAAHEASEIDRAREHERALEEEVASLRSQLAAAEAREASTKDAQAEVLKELAAEVSSKGVEKNQAEAVQEPTAEVDVPAEKAQAKATKEPAAEADAPAEAAQAKAPQEPVAEADVPPNVTQATAPREPVLQAATAPEAQAAATDTPLEEKAVEAAPAPEARAAEAAVPTEKKAVEESAAVARAPGLLAALALSALLVG